MPFLQLYIIAYLPFLQLYIIAYLAILGTMFYNEDMNIWIVSGTCLLLISMLLINGKKQEYDKPLEQDHRSDE